MSDCTILRMKGVYLSNVLGNQITLIIFVWKNKTEELYHILFYWCDIFATVLS
jgi:hypothetical protein